MKNIRFGISGFGRFAEKAILPAMRATPGIEVVALQKRSGAEARLKAAEFGIPHAFGSIEELSSHPDVDAIFCVAANSVHCRDTVIAAENGKHVIVEKPMAMNSEEARQMIDACKRGGVRLMVGQMVRLSPLARRIRAIIDSEEIGRVTYAQADFVYDGRKSKRVWLTDARVAGGGPLFDVGVHCIDTLRYVLADEPVEVRATLVPTPTPGATETDAHVSLRFSEGAIGVSFTSYSSAIRRTRIEISGTEGSLSADEFTKSFGHVALRVRKGKNDVQTEERVEEFEVPNLYVEELTQFCRSVREGVPMELSGENGLANMRVLDEALADNLSRSPRR